MSHNRFGRLFTVTTFGESHGPAIGCVIDGCPPGLEISAQEIKFDLARRATGKSRHTSQRKEKDDVQILSGLFEGRTTGTPIALLIENTDARSRDYENIKRQFRPGHADYTYWKKYGFRDYRGGGRSSARETTMRVAAGALARKWLRQEHGIEIQGWLVYPPGFDPDAQYPLILEIHGGPFAAYGPAFSVETQLFAAAGYVVLYTNPRGSTSYGWDFANEIHHNYPGQDYDDLISGVDAVIAQGYVDPEQLYVTGGSGGGVLTAWIVGKTDKFAAAVSAKPVINWTSEALYSDISRTVPGYWFEKTPWEDPDEYWRRSPLSLVGNVTTPTMLMTGVNDLRTPMPQTEEYYAALKVLGVETAIAWRAASSVRRRRSTCTGIPRRRDCAPTAPTSSC